MHSQAALTIREWQRHELLVDAEHKRLMKLLPTPTPTPRLALARWLQALGRRLTGMMQIRHGWAGRLVPVSR